MFSIKLSIRLWSSPAVLSYTDTLTWRTYQKQGGYFNSIFTFAVTKLQNIACSGFKCKSWKKFIQFINFSQQISVIRKEHIFSSQVYIKHHAPAYTVHTVYWLQEWIKRHSLSSNCDNIPESLYMLLDDMEWQSIKRQTRFTSKSSSKMQRTWCVMFPSLFWGAW